MSLRALTLKVFEAELKGQTEVAIGLSSGVDSRSCLFACLELGKKVTAYTFHIDGIESQDFVQAKADCKTLGIRHVEAVMPKKAAASVVVKIIATYKKFKKTGVECTYPFFYMAPMVEQETFITGVGVGAYMPDSRRYNTQYKHLGQPGLEKWRCEKLANPDNSKILTLNVMSRHEGWGVKFTAPFRDPRFLDWFEGKTLADCNKPKPKQILVDAFPEWWEKVKYYRPMNFQCGDTGIRESFECLLADRQYNFKRRVMMQHLYKDLFNYYAKRS